MSKNADAILLVEDNPDDAELTKLALSRHGLDGRVTHVSDGMQALDYLHRRNGFTNRSGANPVLVLLDLKMPLLDGIGVLKEIKGSDLLHNIPVVVLTTSSEEGDRLAAFNNSVAGYMVKPVDYPQFVGIMSLIRDYWMTSVTPP